MQHEKIKLNNNLETLFIDTPGSTAGSVQIWFRAGSALEEDSNEGIAHFLEHMFFKGTPTRPGAAIAHEVESFGGEINAFTSFDYTCYYINTPNNHLKKTVDILLDMVSNPQFKEEDIIPERGVVFEEFRRSIDNSHHFAFHRIQKSSFTLGYAHPILGREETIKNFSQEQLNNFRNKFYNLENSLLIVSGDLKEKEAIKSTIETYSMPSGEKTTFPEFKLKSRSTLDVHQKDVRMMTLNFCLQAPRFDQPNAAAEDLAINCLGHGESSRLYKNLVHDGQLANSSGSNTMFMNKGGLHFIRVSFPPENLNKTLKKIETLLIKTLKNGLEDEETRKIKNQYVASKVYDMENLESYSFSLGHSYAQTGEINSEEEFIERIKKTSTSAVNSALANIFSRQLHINLQIPRDVPVNKAKAEVKKFHTSFSGQLKKVLGKKESKYKIQKSKFDPQVQLVTIKNGVQLLYRKNDMNPTFVLHAYLKGGITEETEKTNGSYNIISSLLIKGYNKKKYEDLKLDLENKSASLSGFSGKNAYGLTMHGQSEHFQELVEHFSGALINPDMPATWLKYEKEIVNRQLEQQKEDPVKHCFKNVGEIFFNQHPYSLPVQGNKKSVRSLTRKTLSELHQQALQKKDVLFTYCGDKELVEVIDFLSDTFGALKSRTPKKPSFKKVKPLQGASRFIPFNREQTQIFIGIPTAKLNSKENLYLKMLTTHLSGQSSELFVEVRDRQGLCYAAQPVNFSALEAGYWGIYMASGHDKVPAAINAIKGILNNLAENGLSKEEFDRIKNMIEGQSQLNVQTNDDYANIYSVTTLQGCGLDYYHIKNKNIHEMKYEDFQKQIGKILRRKWSTVVVGREEGN